jgi:hypothetical protein
MREDDQGGVSNWVFPELGVMRAKATLAMVAISAGGTSESAATKERQATDAQRLLDASRVTPHLRTAVLLWAFPDRAWWLLYRVVEDIETHLNELGIAT